MKWKLPKTFKISKTKKGFRQRQDGEPRFLELIKYANDRTLTAQESVKCCDCGLTHLHTYNIVRIRLKKRNKWYLVERAYRIQGTGDRNG